MYAAVDWNAVGAIGQWAGAIATFLAVIVALRVARRASSIQIEVKSWLAVRSRGGPVVVFDAINFSQWPVKLTSIGFKLPNETEGVVPAMLQQLPQEAQPLQRISVEVAQHDLATALKVNQFQPGDTLRVYFGDATGGRHWYRWKNCRPDLWDKP